MKYVEEYLTRHHLIHAPHKWFLAFLCSPIHYLEIYYKQKYHLNFTHARKLFLFDMMLLITIIILIGATIIWFNYDPTIDELVYINIRPSQDKMLSGDYVSFEINYKNESDKKLVSPTLKLQLPPNFLIEKIEPEEYQNSSTYFELPNLKPNDEGSIVISGWTYGTPDAEEMIMATLSYQQDSRKLKEEKNVAFIRTLRGSVLNTEINLTDKILSQGTLPITISLENNGEQILSNISLPLPINEEISFSNTQVDFGEIKNNTWLIPQLDQQRKITLTANLVTNLKTYQKEVSFNFTPSIDLNGAIIPQKTVTKKLTVLHPQIEIQTYWQNNLSKIKPTGVAVLEFEITNTGNTTLTNAQIEIPLGSGLIDSARLAQLNLGKIINNNFVVNKENLPTLATIQPNESFKHSLQIPIVYWPQGGVDQTLNITPRIQSAVEDVPNSKYESTGESPALAVGTQINLQAETRYYTNEGDQIGRGPLPPQVGAETKYWAMLKIQNATSQVKNLILTANLPDYVVWTGKSSVSHGQDVSYDSAKRQITWQLTTFPPYTQAGIYFEVSLTPDDTMIDKTPIILNNIKVTGTDNYIEENITQTVPDIDISLPNDQLGKDKGTSVIK